MREKWIDNAKGIAILLVILGHTSGSLDGLWDFHFVYGFHLMMFFLLSGYTMKRKDFTVDYVNQKFRRLMVPYFFTCFAIILTNLFNSWYIYEDTSIKTLTYSIGKNLLRGFFASGSQTMFGSIDLGTRIGAIWFLPAMFFAVIIFQFLLNKIQDDRVLGCVTAGIALCAYITARFLWLPFSVQSGMMATFFLWIGYEIRKFDLLSRLRWYHYVLAQICLLLGIRLGYCSVGFVDAYAKDLIVSIPVGLSGCLLIYLLSRLDTRGRLLGYLGRISLIILCVHLYCLEIIYRNIMLRLDRTGLTGNAMTWAFILVEILMACLIAVGIDGLQHLFKALRARSAKEPKPVTDSKRDTAIDIVKGILILMMLIGHFSIDGRLRSVIYSCHMMAFVFFSGYFYKSGRSILQTLKRMLKSFLLPYGIYVVFAIALDYPNRAAGYPLNQLPKYLTGLSFTDKLLTDIPSIGPVYFILMLFVTRALYMILDRIAQNKRVLIILVLLVSVLGFHMGHRGWWLPWSIDIACYAVIFYHLGRIARERQILMLIRKWHISYFVLSSVWVYMIYAGSMEIAIRNYGRYGVVVIGAAAGTMLLYKLAVYIGEHRPAAAKILNLLGANTIIIMIVHTLLGSRIGNLLALRFDREYAPFMIISIVIQLIISIIVKIVVDGIKKGVKIQKTT